MKLIYVAGPYTAPTISGIDDNIKEAEFVTAQLLKAGWAVICPHKNTSHFEVYSKVGYLSREVFLENDIELLSRCDAIFMMNGWINSDGAVAERDHALGLGLKIFHEPVGIPSPEELE